MSFARILVSAAVLAAAASLPTTAALEPVDAGVCTGAGGHLLVVGCAPSGVAVGDSGGSATAPCAESLVAPVAVVRACGPHLDAAVSDAERAEARACLATAQLHTASGRAYYCAPLYLLVVFTDSGEVFYRFSTPAYGNSGVVPAPVPA